MLTATPTEHDSTTTRGAMDFLKQFFTGILVSVAHERSVLSAWEERRPPLGGVLGRDLMSSSIALGFDTPAVKLLSSL